MTALSILLEEVKKELRPEKFIISEVEELITAVQALLKKAKIKAEIKEGGSYAKKTFLKNSHDIDLFVAFDQKYQKENISDLLEKTMKPLHPERVHGSRDYFHIKKKYSYEIIPVLAIKKISEAKNITDFSLQHVSWVNKNGKKFKDDIRLAKQFCKSARIYGAESYISGFSGHVLDILVIYYKGFLPLLKQSLRWKSQQVIDYKNAHHGKALFNLNKSKTQSGLIVIDPIVAQRNASAALSFESVKAFQKKAAAFLKKPSLLFFKEIPLDLPLLRKKGAVIITCETYPGKRDVAGAKAVKAFDFVKRSMEDAEFRIKDAGWEWNDTFTMWFIPKKAKLPLQKEHLGPPLEKKNFVEIFKKKYKKTTIKNKRIIALVPRDYPEIRSFVQSLLKHPYLNEKVQKVKII